MELKVADEVFTIKPKMGDNLRISKIMNDSQKTKNLANMFSEFNNLAIDMIVRSDNTLTDEDKQDLQLLIEMNQMAVMEEILIAFRWSTREDFDKARSSDTVKNLIGAN